jgi:hypothetical protein
MERDLIDAAPQGAKVKVVTATNPVERKFAVWIGAGPAGCNKGAAAMSLRPLLVPPLGLAGFAAWLEG